MVTVASLRLGEQFRIRIASHRPQTVPLIHLTGWRKEGGEGRERGCTILRREGLQRDRIWTRGDGGGLRGREQIDRQTPQQRRRLEQARPTQRIKVLRQRDLNYSLGARRCGNLPQCFHCCCCWGPLMRRSCWSSRTEGRKNRRYHRNWAHSPPRC
jgi:hypothetical protein